MRYMIGSANFERVFAQSTNITIDQITFIVKSLLNSIDIDAVGISDSPTFEDRAVLLLELASKVLLSNGGRREGTGRREKTVVNRQDPSDQPSPNCESPTCSSSPIVVW